MFLNETMHPEARGLYAVIRAGAMLDAHDVPDYYAPLVRWYNEQGLTQEKAADLYARIAETFEPKPFHTVTEPVAVSLLSRCLHANAKYYR